ncbi:3-oxoacyl-[acyl-carrier-protein] reductase FabG [Tritonibacter multivorans]|uniref:3-oxoacyl-[acyl-carrier-protein] reductase FabG n=1 Tax=Tritonibacter multivorans TaxID=928856 RepID=A0A0P1G347_9RHOB|nr:SDR family oxidoreductase [Tritonibacter multivorans]MDA7419765.1 SDR family NAD(P)-dependent oxidoreductase [Tritonibacter multivorans]CUH76130.1 3-oxoacyl-[acyl-carrier-protein] reductase FabG [Tritonibacter multivorans]SFC54803.1 7-alpha-hydroxysteroid dehydrogenase [Tritonibacter multivorans]
MSFSISGKTAIVTGAASGIGLAIGRQLANAGANVMFVDTDEAALLAELGEQAEDSNIRYFVGDMRERLAVANLLSATIDAFDEIDILVNGARQVVTSDPLDPQDETVEQLLQQNLMTAMRLSQQVAKRMIRQSEDSEDAGEQVGTIINLSSISARRTHPDLLAYSVASAALDQMTRSLAVALAPHRIRVNSIAFGSVMSASMKEVLKGNRPLREDIEQHTPLGRIAAPTELAETALFLASEASAFLTGQVITVDGGRTLLDPVTVPVH